VNNAKQILEENATKFDAKKGSDAAPNDEKSPGDAANAAKEVKKVPGSASDKKASMMAQANGEFELVINPLVAEVADNTK
jgi:hypothetical protein